jgi:hypothetical protein
MQEKELIIGSKKDEGEIVPSKSKSRKATAGPSTSLRSAQDDKVVEGQSVFFMHMGGPKVHATLRITREFAGRAL